ncbi:MFS transporter [Heyndrickxia sporothermodurans]|nr:MFS transporter [Heyndrickxia sporothermodurans]
MIMPFLSLYIESFGNYSNEYVQRWAGFVFGVTFLVAFFISPVWGRFGDRYGYKPILLITGFGIAISIFFMGMMHHVMGLFILRLFMGIVTGFIPTSIALISSQTPKEQAGKTLGTLQMGTVSGTLFGPLIGGAMADSFGFKYTFIITSISIAIATFGVLFGIVENRKKKTANQGQCYSRKDVIRKIFNHRILITVMIIALLIQVANFSIQPLLALYVSQLSKGESVAFLAGMAFSATGFGNLLMTRQWGKLGDKIGHEKVLMCLLILASIFIIPQALATNLWELVIFRFLFGMAIGGMLPSITAFIRREAPIEMQGEVLGYNQSFRFLGNVLGPVLGGVVSGYGGITTVFYVTSALFIIAFGILLYSVRHDHRQLKEGY